MSKFNVIHPSCRQERYEIQNDGNNWHIDEKNMPIKIVGFEIFEKYNLEQPKPSDIPNFETKRAVDWIKVAKEAPIKDILADGGEAALLVATEEIVLEVADGIRR